METEIENHFHRIKREERLQKGDFRWRSRVRTNCAHFQLQPSTHFLLQTLGSSENWVKPILSIVHKSMFSPSPHTHHVSLRCDRSPLLSSFSPSFIRPFLTWFYPRSFFGLQPSSLLESRVFLSLHSVYFSPQSASALSTDYPDERVIQTHFFGLNVKGNKAGSDLWFLSGKVESRESPLFFKLFSCYPIFLRR